MNIRKIQESLSHIASDVNNYNTPWLVVKLAIATSVLANYHERRIAELTAKVEQLEKEIING